MAAPALPNSRAQRNIGPKRRIWAEKRTNNATNQIALEARAGEAESDLSPSISSRRSPKSNRMANSNEVTFMRTFSLLFLFVSLAHAEEPSSLDRAVHDYLAVEPEAPAKGKWLVKGNLGGVATSGRTNNTTVTAGIDAVRNMDPWTLTLRYRGLYTEQSSVETDNEHIGTERLERLLVADKSWFFQDLLLEHDAAENVNIRLILTGGYRRKIIGQEKLNFFFDIGLGYRREELQGNQPMIEEGIAQVGVDHIWQLTKHLTWQQKTVWFPSITNGGDFRFTHESIFLTPVSDSISLRLGLFLDYNSDPPAGVDEEALKFTIGLEFTL